MALSTAGHALSKRVGPSVGSMVLEFAGDEPCGLLGTTLARIKSDEDFPASEAMSLLVYWLEGALDETTARQLIDGLPTRRIWWEESDSEADSEPPSSPCAFDESNGWGEVLSYDAL